MTDAAVCVLGAGPAGCAAATRLAGGGHDVVVVEARASPRPHVGESLGPGVRPVLGSVGLDDGSVEELVDGPDHGPPMSLVRWTGPDERRIGPDRHRTVDRAVFDAALLRNAIASGARVVAPVRAGRPRRTAGGWEVPLADGRVLRSTVVVDATGRRRLLGGTRRIAGARTTALHAVWETTAAPAAPRWSVVDTGPSHWAWAGRRPDGTTRVTVVADPASVTSRHGSPADLYRELVARSEPLTALLDGARPGPVEVCDATSYGVLPEAGVEEPDGPLAVGAGEAAFALDPMSACGVQEALRSGIVAAAVVRTALLRPSDREIALRFHRDLRAHTLARHTRTAAALHAEHRTWADRPFWSARSVADAPPTNGGPAASAPPIPRGVRGSRSALVAGAGLVDVPVLAGDVIELRPALVGPHLERPVAYLGGEAIEPAIRRACDGATGGAADWLAGRGILEPAATGR